MTELEKRAKQFTEEWKLKYEEASRDGYYPSLWVHLENLCTTFAQQETKLLSQHILDLQADKGILTDELNTCQELLGKEKVKNVEQSLKLTEAKEIIRELLNIIDYLNEDEYGKEDFPVVHKAEAFLNSEVEKC